MAIFSRGEFIELYDCGGNEKYFKHNFVYLEL